MIIFSIRCNKRKFVRSVERRVDKFIFLASAGGNQIASRS